MHVKSRPRLSRHRQTRIIAWALAMLLWLHSVLRSAHVRPRHIRQRGAWLSLDDVARLVTDLIGVRAAALAGNGAPRKRLFRDRGVDLRPHHYRRSVVGSRLRRALKHRDFDTRVKRLIDALRDLEVFATRLAQRMRRRVTKLWAIPACSGACQPLAAGAAVAVGADDTS